MRPSQHLPPFALWGGLGAMALVLGTVVPARPEPFPQDQVEALRQALRSGVRDPLNADELSFRKANLKRRIKELRSLGDLSQALGLQEWRDEDRDVGIRDLDRLIREEVAKRLAKDVRAVLQDGDLDSRLAAVALIGEMGVTVRGVGTRTGYAREFGPDLARLVNEGPPMLRAAAARTLGQINPDPEPAAKTLGGRFAATATLDERRAAAEGLVGMIHGISLLAKGRSTTGVEATSGEVILTGTAAVTAAGKGLNDPDADVRRNCLEAMKTAGTALADLIVEPRSPQEFPPEGRKLSEEERKDIEAYKAQVKEEREERMPLVRALSGQTTTVARALADSEPPVCIAACAALEELATSHFRLARRAASLDKLGDKDAAGKKAADTLLPGLREAVPGLATVLTHKEVRVRLAALYALETLEAEAAPAAPALVKALDDGDPFVRWGAARALGKMGPHGGASAVIGLTRKLDDDNGDVRLTAVAALARYGPVAKGAVPALGKVASGTETETEVRLLAIQALVEVGTDAQPAIPDLITALSASDAPVRRATARLLGKFGSIARPAVEPLRKALGDADAEVRQEAAVALLNIVPRKQER